MINRRDAIRIVLAVLPAAWLLRASPARAQQAFQRFIPYLIDLDGWQGKKPDGLAMETPGNNMIMASREYTRGPARLHAQIVIGAAAQAALAATQAKINLETSEGRMTTSTIDGLPATRTYNNKDKSGAVLVALGPAAMFSVSFNGLGDDEGLGLAKKFDWKAIQGAIPK